MSSVRCNLNNFLANHFLEKKDIEAFIKVGENEIQKILSDLDDDVKFIVQNQFNLSDVNRKYSFNYKNKYLKYKKKYINLKNLENNT